MIATRPDKGDVAAFKTRSKGVWSADQIFRSCLPFLAGACRGDPLSPLSENYHDQWQRRTLENAAPPQLNVLAQYVKDLSFENPNSPNSLAPRETQPAINIQINVTAKALAENDYEVALAIEGKAEAEGALLFGFELIYAGVFRVLNVDQENLHPLIMIECPRLLFPFAREIVASSVRNGGFPPMMLDPVDFVGLYRQNMSRQAEQIRPS